MSLLTPCALFDFDGTICPGDSIVPFLFACVRSGLAPRAQLLRALMAYTTQKTGLISAGEAKRFAFDFLPRAGRDAVDQCAQQFMRLSLASRFDPEAVRFLQGLRTEGCHLIAVSASLDVYMRFLPQVLPCDAVLCTEMLTPEGRYTGEIGSNCRDEEKVRRVSAYLADHPGLEAVPRYAMGDSLHDAPMLRMAREPILVHPSRRLRSLFPGAKVLR